MAFKVQGVPEAEYMGHGGEVMGVRSSGKGMGHVAVQTELLASSP